jgi:Hypothetical protein (DUF2513)
MRRDFELVRKLMLAIESRVDNCYFTACDMQKIDNYSLSEVNCHLEWLVDGKLVDGKVNRDGVGEIANVVMRKLSWEGCNFLDDARNESVWKKTMETVKEKTGSVSIALLTQLLISAAKQNLGLG